MINRIKSTFIFLLACTYMPVVLNAQGIEFLHNLDEAIAKAKAEDKIVFVDFYTSWCGPCKTLAAEVFPLAEVGDYFNSRFVNCKIQCDDKGEGVELGKKYQIIAYPTLMFLDKNGEVVHSAAGAPSSDGLIRLAKTATNPERNLQSITNEWNAGNRDEAFTKKYFRSLKEAYRTEKAVADFNTYFNTLSDKEKVKKSIFELISLMKIQPFTPIFNYLEAMNKEYGKSVGVEEVEQYIATTYLWHLQNLVSRGTNEEFQVAKAAFKAKNYSYFNEYAMFYSIYEVGGVNGKFNIKAYMERGTEFLEKYGKNNDQYALVLSSLLGNCTGRADEGAAGIQWMKDLLARNRNPKYLTTYFYILWRNSHFEEAIAVGKEMRENALKAGNSTKAIDSQISMVEGLIAKAAQKAQAAKMN